MADSAYEEIFADEEVEVEDEEANNSSEENYFNDIVNTNNISSGECSLSQQELFPGNHESSFEEKRRRAIKKLTLAKINYHGEHWKTVEAKIDLSMVYLNEKGFPLQAIKHAKTARDQLLLIQRNQDLGKIEEFDFMLQNIYYTLGSAHLQNQDFKNAENCLQKAKLVSDETSNATKKYVDLKLSVLSTLATILSKLKRNGEAVNLLEQAIEINNKNQMIDKSLQLHLHKQIAIIEASNKNINVPFALEACEKALDTSEEINGENHKESAALLNLKSKILLSESNINFESVEDNLIRASSIFKDLQDVNQLINTEQMKCKVYLQEEKNQQAKLCLENVIKLCEEEKGDMSLKTAELYELMGSVLYSSKKISSALRYFSKAEEIYRGKKKYKQKAEKILKLMGMVRKATKNDKLKTSEDKLKDRPRFN